MSREFINWPVDVSAKAFVAEWDPEKLSVLHKGARRKLYADWVRGRLALVRSELAGASSTTIDEAIEDWMFVRREEQS